MTQARIRQYAADVADLHPILKMLVFTFPDAFEIENDHSLIVLDRDRFADMAHQLGSALPEPAPAVMCQVCHDVEVQVKGAMCADCRQREHDEAVRARDPRVLPPANPDRPIPTTLARPRPPAELAPTLPAAASVEPAPVAPVKPAAKVKRTPDVVPQERPPADPPIIVGGLRPGLEPVEIPDSLTEIQRLLANGIPEAVRLELHPNVLELWGVDLEFAVAVVRAPNYVSIDETVKDRGYPVLRFRRGDLYVVVGFKDRQKPAVLGVYAMPMLEHDTHQVGHTGGGGSKAKTLKPPTTPESLIKRLEQIGVTASEPDDKGISALTYEGNDLGKVRAVGPAAKPSVLSDYDRTLRRVQAINRRHNAAGRAS